MPLLQVNSSFNFKLNTSLDLNLIFIYLLSCSLTVFQTYLDACKKTGLLVTSVVSTIDLINCKQIKLQITGSCPTISVDKSDALELYVSKESLGVEVFSAKSSGVNVLFEEKEEWVEKAVCEQFKTVIKGGELVSVAVEHKG